MSAQILDGKALASSIKAELTTRVAALKAKGITPGLGTVLVGTDPGSLSYVGGKHRDCKEVGINSIRVDLPESATERDVLAAIADLNSSKECTGYIVQLPLPKGIDTQVGERGAKISGGQRQRLGIARAMFTRPRLLVLDEATSSLDGETEANISEAIHELRGSITVITIAHRLSTVRDADLVVYLSKGKVQAKGTFEEVRNTVPDFDKQAKLMGL